jgi:flagellar assembly protein FliH
MSPKASVASQAAVAKFTWSATGEQPTIVPDALVSAPAAAQPQRRLPDPAEQEAHLAALERDAFAKGYAQGERAGLEAGNKRSDAMLRRLGETLEELASLRQSLLHHSERQLVQLALALAKRIVRREVGADEELLAALARVALDRLGNAGPATIRLHPDDFARAAARGADRWAAAHVTVVADPAVSRGGCLVESPFGFVDASIDAQFQELARALLDGDTASYETKGDV